MYEKDDKMRPTLMRYHGFYGDKQEEDVHQSSDKPEDESLSDVGFCEDHAASSSKQGIKEEEHSPFYIDFKEEFQNVVHGKIHTAPFRFLGLLTFTFMVKGAQLGDLGFRAIDKIFEPSKQDIKDSKEYYELSHKMKQSDDEQDGFGLDGPES